MRKVPLRVDDAEAWHRGRTTRLELVRAASSRLEWESRKIWITKQPALTRGVNRTSFHPNITCKPGQTSTLGRQLTLLKRARGIAFRLACGNGHSVGLRADGTVVAIGVENGFFLCCSQKGTSPATQAHQPAPDAKDSDRE